MFCAVVVNSPFLRPFFCVATMTFHKSLAVFFSLMIAVSARRMAVHESLAAAPGSFVSQGAAPATDMLTLRLALAPNNIAGLQAKMTSISTPGSSEHRQWLSTDEVLCPPSISP
jgi:tripeptidyl-peptidase-1